MAVEEERETPAGQARKMLADQEMDVLKAAEVPDVAS